ncbi:MAG: hypothetical protein ACR2PI_11585 [Hyphomicrobiaceae bacterium]
MKRILICGVIALLAVAVAYLYREFIQQRSARSARSAEILVLGDSQLSFGAGPVLSAFFDDLPNQCREHVNDPLDLGVLKGKRFAMIGTRSTSLQSWTTSRGKAWELLCHKDKRWGVNASTWGLVKSPDRRYVQIGEGANFQFCTPPETPLQNLFATGYYEPELLMIFVGGNGAARLADNSAMAEQDVAALLADMPDNTGCVFMMTAPIFSNSHNDKRVAAQAHLRAAFADHAHRCSFVDGHTPATRAAIEGKAQFFRRRADGTVKDPYHANEDAAGRFLDLRRGPLCRALAKQLRRRAGQGAS